MNDNITITNSQPENKKEQVIWEEKESITLTKKNELPSTNDVCDIITKINALNENVPLRDITKTNPIKISGIYKIVNKINGIYYVGSAKNINYKHRCRWYEHYFELTHNIHKNKRLQSDWNLYGETNFRWLIEEEVVDVNKLKPTEQKYLDICKQNQLGCYNKNFTAQGWECGKLHINYKPIDATTTDYIRKEWMLGGEVRIRQLLKSMGYGIGVMKRLVSIFKMDLDDYKEYRENVKSRLGVRLQKGKTHACCNTTNYKFINQSTNITFEGIPIEFYTKYGLSRNKVSMLVRGKCVSYNNWIVSNPTPMPVRDRSVTICGVLYKSKKAAAKSLGVSTSTICRHMSSKIPISQLKLNHSLNMAGSKNPKYDHRIYKFVNTKLNIEFIGTRFDFKNKHNIHWAVVGNLVNKRIQFTMTGWIFLGEVI
jgi:hypothetical protein